MRYIIVFITASSEEEALRIADGLIDSKSAACVNIISNVKSVFLWKGKKDAAYEHLLIAKTKEDKFDQLKAKVKELHSYEVPEIISVSLADGDKIYLDWLGEAL